MLHIALGAENTTVHNQWSLLWRAHHLSEEFIHMSMGALPSHPCGSQRSSRISLCGIYFNKPSCDGK